MILLINNISSKSTEVGTVIIVGLQGCGPKPIVGFSAYVAYIWVKPPVVA